MENTGSGSFLRNRRLESFLDRNSGSNVRETPKISCKEVARQKPKTDAFVVDDDDGWISTLISCVRIVTCFLTMMVTSFIWAIILVFLLPWPSQRIRQGNVYGHVTGRLLMWILGNPIKIEGKEFSNERAIYISNHASPIDIFLIMWLTPTGTVGIAKKEDHRLHKPSSPLDILHRRPKLKIVEYTLVHMFIPTLLSLGVSISQMECLFYADHMVSPIWTTIRFSESSPHYRSNRSTAIQSMKEAVQAVIKHNLSLLIFPEGTRSKNGQLLPFKKGFVHLALQSRLPIVPIVMTGTHLAWRKGSLHVRPAPISVTFLPPIKTDGWTDDKISDYVKLLHDIYVENLPESQKPIVSEASKNSSRS